MWLLRCPECSYKANAKEFAVGGSNERSCPNCQCFFQWDPPAESPDGIVEEDE